VTDGMTDGQKAVKEMRIRSGRESLAQAYVTEHRLIPWLAELTGENPLAIRARALADAAVIQKLRDDDDARTEGGQ